MLVVQMYISIRKAQFCTRLLMLEIQLVTYIAITELHSDKLSTDWASAQPDHSLYWEPTGFMTQAFHVDRANRMHKLI